MAEIQQPDIVGNYLSNYAAAQQQQTAQQDRQMQQQDRQFQQERVGQQDQRAEALYKLQMMDGVVKTLGNAKDEAGLDQAKQQWVAMGLPAEAVAHFTAADIPMLREKAGVQFEELKGQLLRTQIKGQEANIRQSDAAAAQSYAAARKYQTDAAGHGGTYGVGTEAPEVAPGVFVPDPYANISDPKQRDQFYRQNAKEFGSRQVDFQTTRRDAQNVINSTKEFTALNAKVGSGGLTGTGGWSTLPGVDQIRRSTDPNWSRMSSIMDRLTPLMRQGLPGAASERDTAMFRGATVGTDKPQSANVAIATGLQAAAQNAIDKGNFDEWYFQKYRHLQGSDNAWNRYLEDNKIFDPNSDLSDLKPNESRQNWREYFGAGGQRAQEGPQSFTRGGAGVFSEQPAGQPPAQQQQPQGWSIKRVQ